MPAANKGRAVEEILMVSVTLNVCDRALVDDLVAALTELPGVDADRADGANFDGE